MKHFHFGIAGIIALFCFHPRLYPQQLAENLNVRSVAPDVYVVTHTYPWPSNSLVVYQDGHLILVDTPYTPEATRKVLDWALKKYPGSDITEINTHFHIDRLGGNQAIRECGHIIGSDLTLESIQKRGQTSLELLTGWVTEPEMKKYYKNFKYVKPDVILHLTQGVLMPLGSLDVILLYPGPGHSPDNSVVYFPEKKVLFGGCMILDINVTKPGNTADANLGQWAFSLSNIRTNGYEIVIPGHGDWGGLELISHTVEILTNL